MNSTDKDVVRFYELCEYYLMKNIELSMGIPTNTKLKNNIRYLLIYLDMIHNDHYLEHYNDISQYLENISYDEEFILEIKQRIKTDDKMLDLLDYLESYLVDEAEKDLYGHGRMCYSSLFNTINLILRIKKKKYNYPFDSVNDLLIRGYYFSEEEANRFQQLAVSHTPEQCPD